MKCPSYPHLPKLAKSLYKQLSLSRSVTLALLLPLGLAGNFASAQAGFLGESSSSSTATSSSTDPAPAIGAYVGFVGSTRGVAISPVYPAPVTFSRVAFGSDISPLGVGFMVATNLSHHLNFRANGSMFNYSASSFNTQGFNVNGQIKMASARTSVDYYPFHSGFRLSPGVMFYNQNRGNFNLAAVPGQGFSLNNQTYYSEAGANATTGTGKFGLGNGSPALTMTTGWGNIIPHSGGRISFPFEVGAAFIKQPTLGINLTGYSCNIAGENCVNMATDPDVQANLAAQVKSYENDIQPLKTFPIISFGVAYNFGTRRGSFAR